jgi:LmbE family N-acetylglucosaminyl deacetylase
MTDAYNSIFKDKKTVMVIMAHPDDMEVMAGGTVARLVADGKKVISVKVTSGNRGSRGAVIPMDELAKIRATEDAESMKVLGIPPEHSVILGVNDGEVENSFDVIGKISLQIRKFQPELIITFSPDEVFISHGAGKTWVNHRDHRNTAMCAIDAAYPFSRDRSFFPEQFEQPGIEPAHCTEFLIADSSSNADEVFINVADYVETAKKATMCHKSQMDEKEVDITKAFFTTHDNVDGAHEKFRHIVL